ncbi:DNA-processing protein DprA [Alphaproteobacteria bacterium]|nr:DNA-processing protein DprA [Alphaproteobacteria bacterium]
MEHSEKLARIRLIRTQNVGPMTYKLLMSRYQTAKAALRAVPELAKRGGRKLVIASLADAEAEFAANEEAGATLLFRGTEQYPSQLDMFDDAPALLSAKGNLHLLQKPMLAMVGARNASINAIRLSEKIASELGAHGYVIVSGLARGIDTAAHNGALDNGTIAVIASGIDLVYPQENTDLFDAIIERGLLLAEMPPGTQPTPRHFPIRNRIIAGLSHGVIVVEAASKSGSLITARETGERGGEVMAIPGSPLDPRSEGCNKLIREGATLVQNTSDILECLSRPFTASQPSPPPPVKDPNAPEPKADDVNKCRIIISENIGPDPVAIDDIIHLCDMPASIVWAALLELELAGTILRHHGNRISKIVSFNT